MVGLPNRADVDLPLEVSQRLAAHAVFSGGRRHYALVRHLLPAGHTWITIGGDMPALFAQYRAAPGPILVFASGDPLFYGIVRTIQAHDPGLASRCIRRSAACSGCAPTSASPTSR